MTISTWGEAEATMERVYRFMVERDLEEGLKSLDQTPFDFALEGETRRARKLLGALRQRRLDEERAAKRKEETRP